MNKKRKVAIILASVAVVICSAAFIYSEKNKIKSAVQNSSDKEPSPENIEDIPPSIIDNVAPDVEQKFKAEAKDFEVHDKDGNEIRLSDYKGQYVILNFWNSSCAPCTKQLPYFEEAIKKYEGQVKFLMINIVDGESETIGSALKYLKDNNINIDTTFDDHYDVRINYKIATLPRTIFIDKNGLIQKDAKFELNEETLETQIQNLINSEN